MARVPDECMSGVKRFSLFSSQHNLNMLLLALWANTLGMLTCFTFNFFAPGFTFAFFATGTATLLAVTPGFTFAFFAIGTAALDVTAFLFRFLDLVRHRPGHKPKKN